MNAIFGRFFVCACLASLWLPCGELLTGPTKAEACQIVPACSYRCGAGCWNAHRNVCWSTRRVCWHTCRTYRYSWHVCRHWSHWFR